MTNASEWSVSNHLDFLGLRMDDCDRFFKDMISKLCSPDRKNVAAQLSLFEDISSLNTRIDSQIENIQKFIKEASTAVNNGDAADFSVIGEWEKRIGVWKNAVSQIGNSLQKVINGEPSAEYEIVNAVKDVNYEYLGMEKPDIDKSLFEPITFNYLRERFDHCLSLLQNIFLHFFRKDLDLESAQELLLLIKAFNSDFELQKQNISLYESQLYENLSFRDDGNMSVETELNQLCTFTENIELWSRLPLDQISGIAIQRPDAEVVTNNGLYDQFKQIDFISLGLESPSISESNRMRYNLALFRPKFATRRLAWMWINKLKLNEGSEEIDNEPVVEKSIPEDMINEYCQQLQQFMRETEGSIDSYIEGLLTCKIDRSAFDAQFAECERLKTALRAQRGQMRALRNQLTTIPTDDHEGLIALASRSYNITEWIQMVDVWLRVLQSLTSLLTHMARTSGDGPLDDAVELLRETIERDLFIPSSATTSAAATTDSGNPPPASNTNTMEQ
uniref:Uncharacterized protein n=1 Tax=Panagrolaimus superbus TaxID=310955 RepID=A0A914XXR0_9BILA